MKKLILLLMLPGLAFGQGSSATPPNATTTGTTANLLAKITSAGAIITATTDGAIPMYIVVGGAGTAGNPSLAVAGDAYCIFDGTPSAIGDFVQNSTTTAGECHDAGSTRPTGGTIVGIVKSVTGSGACASTCYLVGVTGPDDQAGSGGNIFTGGWSAGVPPATGYFPVASRGTVLATATGPSVLVVPRAITVTGISAWISVANSGSQTIPITLVYCTTTACSSVTTTAATCTIGNSTNVCSASGLSVSIPSGSLIEFEENETGTVASSLGTAAVTYQ